jgi:hypothetical protein
MTACENSWKGQNFKIQLRFPIQSSTEIIFRTLWDWVGMKLVSDFYPPKILSFLKIKFKWIFLFVKTHLNQISKFLFFSLITWHAIGRLSPTTLIDRMDHLGGCWSLSILGIWIPFHILHEGRINSWMALFFFSNRRIQFQNLAIPIILLSEAIEDQSRYV